MAQSFQCKRHKTLQHPGNTLLSARFSQHPIFGYCCTLPTSLRSNLGVFWRQSLWALLCRSRRDHHQTHGCLHPTSYRRIFLKPTRIHASIDIVGTPSTVIVCTQSIILRFIKIGLKWSLSPSKFWIGQMMPTRNGCPSSLNQTVAKCCLPLIYWLQIAVQKAQTRELRTSDLPSSVQLRTCLNSEPKLLHRDGHFFRTESTQPSLPVSSLC